MNFVSQHGTHVVAALCCEGWRQSLYSFLRCRHPTFPGKGLIHVLPARAVGGHAGKTTPTASAVCDGCNSPVSFPPWTGAGTYDFVRSADRLPPLPVPRREGRCLMDWPPSPEGTGTFGR
jgi:hypothetical protein